METPPLKIAEVFYDDGCALCSSFRRWLERRAPGRFRFVPISTLAPAEQAKMSSLIVRFAGHRWTASEAVFRVLGLLPWPWRVFSLGRWIPRPWRDALYRFIARRRYRLGRAAPQCECPL
ncbi:MAG: DCC1-like thiol-disulfide oxidoreductase family protein [Bacteroidetes bacterium]|nr:DCC1-like thiol-disulfide oxidoreductase family protein [Rhodothermia bacterium]MCS7154942.1 DCC1-like thiol-disulfide oxidoreductase family protein [Bacteroidota bacterium]MCX7907226.1 DCC1-like thiol-disulfide oxidoreductase family protein [Bacteroidota bacterium]MDW8138048.1 DCC1-like thiol-disulfide oxidoreductase family protein [Bacteroidota bacterium]